MPPSRHIGTTGAKMLPRAQMLGISLMAQVLAKQFKPVQRLAAQLIQDANL